MVRVSDKRVRIDRNDQLGFVSPRKTELLLKEFEQSLDLELLRHRILAEKFPHKGYESQVFALEYLKKMVFSKYVVLSKGGAEDRRQAAIEKWLLMELRNAKSNQRLLGVPAEICGVQTDDLLSWAARLIAEVIGEKPPYDVLYGTFSGGASTSTKRGPGNIASKFGDKAEVTAQAWELFRETLINAEAWNEIGWKGSPNPKLVSGNVLFTVPKNSKIDRVAAKEPDLNMFAQKGIGNFIRKSLKRHGVDLNDQTVNQRLAEEGSRENTLATVDLSSASDSVSIALVRRLLPDQWYKLLDASRSQSTWVDGREHTLSMFSSMGNGFTFELESLIFWAICRGIAYFKGIRGRVNVYGDDIVVPVKMFPMLKSFLSYFGFILNKEKSFGKGEFRESCGKHYHAGHDVTPFFVRGPLMHQSDLILFLNNLTRWLRTVDSIVPETNGDSFPFLNEVWNAGSLLVDRKFRGGSVDWLGSNTVLVSGDKPKSRLVNTTREVALPQDGSYLHWLRIRDEASYWPDRGRFIGPLQKREPRPASVWRIRRSGVTNSLTLREPLITSVEVVTLTSQWAARPYKDVVYAEEERR